MTRDDLGRKRCPRCGEWKPEGDFYASRKGADGLAYGCKLCQAAVQRAKVPRRHGLTEVDYDALSAGQGDACAICRQPCRLGALSIDHDHACCPAGDRSCGECIRGLLCRTCNVALGNMRDDPTLLRRAAEYLEQRIT